MTGRRARNNTAATRIRMRRIRTISISYREITEQKEQLRKIRKEPLIFTEENQGPIHSFSLER